MLASLFSASTPGYRAAMTAPKLKQDADRARRIIGWMNDEDSVRILRRYADELEAELTLSAGAAGSDRRK